MQSARLPNLSPVLLTAILLAAGLASVPTAGADAAQNLALQLPGPNGWMMTAYTGSAGYIFGGWTGSQYLATALRFDPGTETLAAVATPLPYALSGAGAVWTGTEVLLVGGQTTGNAYLDTIVAFDPLTETFTTKGAHLPGARGYAAVAWDPRDRPADGCPGGCVYVLGGRDASFAYRTVFRYNPATDTAADTGTLLPATRYLTAGAYAAGKVFAFGGVGSSSDVVRYDPAADTAGDVGFRFTDRHRNVAVAAEGDSVWVVGGRSGPSGTYGSDEVYDFDGASEASSLYPARLPASRTAPGVIRVGEQAWVFGGGMPTTPVRTVAHFHATAVPPPNGLSATHSATAGAIDLAWSVGHDDGATGFRLYRGTAGGPLVAVADIPAAAPAGTFAYVDAGLSTHATTYTYQVATLKGTTESPRSNTASATPRAYPLRDSMESGPGKWTVTNGGGPASSKAWAITTQQAASPTHSFGIGGTGGYGAGEDDTLALATPLDLTGFGSARLQLSHRMLDAVPTIKDDTDAVGRLEVSRDGASWTQLGTWKSTNGWQALDYDVTAFTGGPMHLRFRFASTAPTADPVGWWIDDVLVWGYANTKPVASFTATPSGRTLAVDATATTDADGDALAYAWSWGDGASGTGVSASHAYAGPGLYTVTLDVTDGKGGLARTVQAHAVGTSRDVVRFRDDFESGLGQWSVADQGGAGTWAITSQRSVSPSRSLGIGGLAGYGALSNDHATTVSAIDVGGLVAPTLRLRHLAAGEQKCTPVVRVCGVDADYGQAELSPDGGATWIPLGGRAVSTAGAFATVEHPLSAYAATPFLLRLRWTSDADTQNEGWYVDDVEVVGTSNVAPTASFTAVMAGRTVSVDASASTDPDGDALTFAWDWGDGTAAGTGAQATHTYAASGAYTVRLTVTDTFTGQGAAQATALPMQAWEVLDLLDGAEAGMAAWTVDDQGGVGSWQPSTERAASGVRSFALGGAAGYAPQTDDALVTASAIDLTARSKAWLRVRHHMDDESCDQNVCIDHATGYVEASGDGGATWDVLGELDTTPGFQEALFSLRPYAGGSVLLRFRMTAFAGSSGPGGWFLDDIHVWSSTNRDPVLGFSVTPTGLALAADATTSSDPDGDPVTVTWTWGDGTSTTGATATHTYGATQFYPVTVTVRDDRDGDASASQSMLMARTSETLLFSDDMESGPAKWTVSDANGYTWHLSDEASYTPSHSWVLNDNDEPSQDPVNVLQAAAPVDLTGYSGAYATFRVQTLGSYIKPWGSFEVSDDGGLTWTRLGEHMFAERYAFATWTIDLQPFVGQPSVLFRFVWESTGSGQPYWRGIYLDDVIVFGDHNTAPSASFTATQSGATVSVDAGTSSDPDGDPLTYSWMMGWGSYGSGTGVTFSHTYPNADIYTIELTVSDGKRSAVAKRTVVVETATQKLPFWDTAEDGLGKWAVTDVSGAGTWHVEPSWAWSPGNSLSISGPGGYAPSGDDRMVAGPISLAGFTQARLEVWHAVEGQDPQCAGSVCTGDYGSIDISTDGGTTWNTVRGEIYCTGYCDSVYWTEWGFNLNAYAGQTVHLRLRWVSDSAQQYDGWYVDDIVLRAS